MSWLGVSWLANPGVDLGNNTTVHLDVDNQLQSDALLSIEPELVRPLD